MPVRKNVPKKLPAKPRPRPAKAAKAAAELNPGEILSGLLTRQENIIQDLDKTLRNLQANRPHDPILAILLGRLEEFYDVFQRSVELRRSSVHPNDPALSTLLARFEHLEDKLDKLLGAVEKRTGHKPEAAPTAILPPVAVSAAKPDQPADPDTSQFLSRTTLFANLSAAECSVLANHLEVKTLAFGSVLFKQGDFGDAMYIVKTGALEIYKSDVFGPMRVAEVKPGGLVGEMALVENKPRSANVRASEDCRLLVLSRAAYADLKKSYAQVATKFQDELLLLLSGRLRQTTEKLVGNK